MPLHLKSLFGPVPSRRLGRSLGIDVIPPKTCTYDCVYCESGRTTELTVQRREFIAEDMVLGDLRRFFNQHAGGADVLTLSSAGEPTLHLGLGRLIERIKTDYPSLPLVVLTNGSLLWDPEVRRDLMRADRVVPSLDAATLDTFRKVDRPHPSLELSAILEGLYAFRRDYRGQLHVEILLVRGMNDDPRELVALRRAIDRVRPDCVELNTVVRPPACPGVRGLAGEEMTAAAGYFHPDTMRIIGRFEPTSREDDDSESLDSRVLQLVTRRPCSVEEMADSLGASVESLQETLFRLLRQEKIRPEQYDEKLFYCPASRS
jgi:wyosine [tRNA(Phe)-imidazoG37] synthetase (radical SAM superfamily)